MNEKIDITELREHDLVFSEMYGGCALISGYVHSYDRYLECSFVWYARKQEMYVGVSVDVDEIRKPTFEEVCEFMRNYVPMAEQWRD